MEDKTITTHVANMLLHSGEYKKGQKRAKVTMPSRTLQTYWSCNTNAQIPIKNKKCTYVYLGTNVNQCIRYLNAIKHLNVIDNQKNFKKRVWDFMQVLKGI